MKSVYGKYATILNKIYGEFVRKTHNRNANNNEGENSESDNDSDHEDAEHLAERLRLKTKVVKSRLTHELSKREYEDFIRADPSFVQPHVLGENSCENMF